MKTILPSFQNMIKDKAFALRRGRFSSCFLTVVAFLMYAQVSMAQMYYIPDPIFRAYLQQAGPMCFVGDSLNTTCPTLQTAQTLQIVNRGIQDLSGIEYFISLRVLDISYNQLLTIPPLPPTVTRLYCYNNQLTSIAPLPPGLEILNCNNNQITSLPDLPATLQYVSVSNNQLNTLPSLPAGMKQISAGVNSLTTLPALPDSLTDLYVENNSLIALPSLPSGLIRIRAYYNSLTSLPLLPSGLKYIEVDNNSLTLLPPLPSGLFSLRASYNQLHCLPLLSDSLFELVFTGNNIQCLPNYPAALDPYYHDSLPLCTSANTFHCSFYPPVSGYSFRDNNQNCLMDSGDTGLPNRVVKLNSNHFTLTNSAGYYITHVDTGQYTINQLQRNALWNITCPAVPYTIQLNNYTDSVTDINFPNNALGNCPWLWVDIASDRQRRCFRNSYYVKYCNYGSVPAINAYIDVTFEPEIIPLSSTLPWSLVVGNTYRFDIGNLGVEQCGAFVITDSVSCNAILGESTCATAEIFPHQPCPTPSAVWDRSSVSVRGACHGDSLCFSIRNTGAAMQGTSVYRIYENNLLFYTGSFQLAAGDSLVVCRIATGTTIRLEADQRPFHPGHSRPRASVELCGSPNNTTGQIHPVAQDDADDFRETDCHVIIGAYDPNDKTVVPSGFGAQHFVDMNEDFEYMIRFQNTGNDTAFTVVIIDSLPSHVLDPGTFVSGASSHLYKVEMYGNGVVMWTFDNILLPDSNVNEAASHGFVKYKIRQHAGNPVGTVISNKAEIYFDYNVAVVTDPAFVTLSDTLFLAGIHRSISYNEHIEIVAYPNPFSHATTIELKLKTMPRSAALEIMDNAGRLLLQYDGFSRGTSFDVERDNLAAGFYFYKIMLDGMPAGSGKLMVRD